MTRKVELAYPYTDADGKNHEADSTVDLPDETAVELVNYGRARWPETKAAAPTSKEK